MTEHLEQKLMNRFPFMEAKNILDGIKLGYAIPMEVNDGWYNLIYSLCLDIERHYCEIGRNPNELNILQIKEKYGELRVEIGNFPQGLQDLIMEYEKLSLKTCHICGKDGKLRDGGWLEVLCDRCNTKYNDGR